MATWRVTFTGIYNNSVTCQNVVAFDQPDSVLTDQQVANELRDNWLTIIAAGQVNTFAWRNISVTRLGSNTSPLNLAINVQGVDGVDNLGGTQITCVKWRIHTGLAGKRGRGSNLLACLPERLLVRRATNRDWHHKHHTSYHCD